MSPSRLIGLTVLTRALSGLAIPISAATEAGVNFVEGAAAAFVRKDAHAFAVTFGNAFAAIGTSRSCNFTDEITPPK